MANLYIADDGTIHDRDIGNCQRVISNGSTLHTSSYTTPAVSRSRKFFFWIITILSAIAIGYVMYSTLGIYLIDLISFLDEIDEEITEFFYMIAPYVLIVGAVVGAIIYGVTCAAKNNYNLATYFLSALSAVGGAIGVTIGLIIISILIIILFYVLVAALIIGIIVALLGGD